MEKQLNPSRTVADDPSASYETPEVHDFGEVVDATLGEAIYDDEEGAGLVTWE